MKQIILTLMFALPLGVYQSQAQIVAPKLSPLAKLETKVGLTDVTVSYSRPSKRGRVVFGDVVPYNELWRLGANENTKLTVSTDVIIGQDTLTAGTYALFLLPTESNWKLVFYNDYSNWGTPDEFDSSKVSLTFSNAPVRLNDVVETLTIDVLNHTTSTADLTIAWDQFKLVVPCKVDTDTQMMEAIAKVMQGPSSSDYYLAADYYYKEHKDLKKAQEWILLAEKQKPDAYWIVRLKALIQYELGDKKAAVQTMEKASELALKNGNSNAAKNYKNTASDWKK